MKKENFVTLILCTVGGILFSLGMCMCLVSQWESFSQGVVLGVIGAAVLIAAYIVRLKMQGKKTVMPSGRTMAAILIGVLGTLLLGVGMCMVMVWDKLIGGVLVGIVGILVLLMLIPFVKGLK